MSERIAACRMCCEQLGRLGIELDLRSVANINLGKIVLIEVAIHHLATFQNMLTLKFLLGTKNIPCSIELLILSVDGLCLLLIVGRKITYISIQVANSFIEF